ncbi:ABC transporter ATP-binding protein [Ktedonobacter sp. SOSP1-52]|uniref:ABC transporter substrate-binding protein n=1 Tax=Ktedonobacter sp. SOSP1-52 TaxID=2778366 RepID=UPI0019157B21|nr:extracellular solute-binding protein [Ktedonobacter sp. SOSP1-52]GHO70669.1 ABC transporter ATP-binding protein [Ktedonobacter sp. SOSP1-52]
MSSRITYTRRRVCQVGLSSLAGVTLLDLVGCGSDTGTAANETLQLSFWGPASRNKLTQNAIKAFQQAHSNITIHSWFADFSVYFNKLNTQIASGGIPDLIQMDMSYVARYVQEHELLDLTPFVNDKTIDLSDFDQGMLKNSEDNGVLYGISLGGNYECMIYDATLIQEAGLGTPPTSWTWNEFATYAGNISSALKSKGVYGSPDASGAIDMFEIWVRQRGKELWTTDGKIMFTVDDIASWFSYWDGMRKSGACVPAQTQATVTGSGPNTSLLAAGKTAFATGHSNQFGSFQALTKHTLALQTVPTGPGPGNYLKPSMLMSIGAKSKYAKDAATFINFLITDPKGAKAIGLDRGVPGSARARAALQPTLKAGDKAVLAYSDLMASNNTASPRTVLDPSGAGKVSTALSNASQAVGFGKQSIMAGANSFYQEAVKAVS